jgi:hypothetical protein
MADTGKILRGCRAMWLNFEADGYTCLGKDSDDLSIDTNPDTEQSKNVQGETTFTHNGYTPSLSNDGYIARKEDAIYPTIQKIANELSEDDATISGTLTVATLDDQVKNATGKTTLKGSGFQVPVKVVVNNDGGGTSGYTIPFTMYEDGARVQGTVSVTDKVPTFTAETSTSSL